MPVLVVSIDGTDFSGKTTIANLVVELLRQMNKEKTVQFKRTEVPSGFVTGTFTKILRNSVDKIPSEVFALVYAADHLFHYNHYIKKLEEHNEKFVVIQERSLLSTYIYQGILGDIDLNWLKEINKFDINIPKLTLILKVPIEEILKRKALENRQFDRFEREEHLRQQVEAYYNLPPELVKQFNVEYIDATGTPLSIAERCAERIQKEIDKFLK